MMKTNIVILASGDLGLHVIQSIEKDVDILCIATDRGSSEIRDYAQKKNIPIYVGIPRNGALTGFLDAYPTNILLSVNYLFLVEEDLLAKFKFPVNFHGSLLPRYRGRTPHVWSIINNEQKAGVTAHFMDAGCDTGDLILQKEINIASDDTGYTLLRKYFDIYPGLVKKVVEMIASSSFTRTPQNEVIATSYGKRTPEDGRLNWDWQKERIYNWVRALSEPYPGAFCFYEGKKLVIDEVGFSPMGYDNSLLNGTILSVTPELIIKTSNGAVRIIRYRDAEQFSLKPKTILE